MDSDPEKVQNFARTWLRKHSELGSDNAQNFARTWLRKRSELFQNMAQKKLRTLPELGSDNARKFPRTWLSKSALKHCKKQRKITVFLTFIDRAFLLGFSEQEF